MPTRACPTVEVSRPSARRRVGASPAGAFVLRLAFVAACVLPHGLLAPGCGPSSSEAATGTSFALVLAPPGATSADGVRDPAPPGSRIVRFDAALPDAPPTPLVDGVAAAALCDVSPDGRLLLVTLQAEAGGPWRVHELPVAGGEPRPLSPAGASAVAAAYLPHDRVVLACDLARVVDPRDGGPAVHLYTCARDGSELQRISFNPSSDTDPLVLPDGRILFAGWQPPGVGRPRGGFALFTVRDDGTGLAAWSGSHAPPADERRPRLVGDEVVCLGGGADGLDLLAIGRRRPMLLRGAPDDVVSSAFRAAARGADGALLCCVRPTDGATTAGLLRVEDGRVASIPVPVGLDVLDVLALAPRPAPKGHLSTIDPQGTSGELLCLDARRAELPGEDAGVAAAAARRAVTLQVLRGLPHEASDAAPAGPRPTTSEPLATLPLAEDGSAWLTVPADTPLRFRTLDAQGEVLLDSTSWVWVRPGERRACIGCHEDRESAPPNRGVAALAGEPWDAASLATDGRSSP